MLRLLPNYSALSKNVPATLARESDPLLFRKDTVYKERLESLSKYRSFGVYSIKTTTVGQMRKAELAAAQHFLKPCLAWNSLITIVSDTEIVGSLYCNYLYPVTLPLSFLSGERLTVSGGPFFCNWRPLCALPHIFTIYVQCVRCGTIVSTKGHFR